ncbi:hypothetical protein SAMN04488691_10548 [Haloferax larsenii]|uniref:Uncharacterized protein n=1 Tax=Haloferax larsenii TaxID=302484 RepID=A0A1H7QJE9_HALLR|nr:hypothetical protein SAMN04488691_10548 [Haloferax larsenii]
MPPISTVLTRRPGVYGVQSNAEIRLLDTFEVLRDQTDDFSTDEASLCTW